MKKKDFKFQSALSALTISLLLIVTSFFCACDNDSDENTLNICNWGEYIDLETIKMFEKESGINVNYNTVPTNEELYSKIRAGGVRYDIIFPSDYMISRMIDEKMLHKINYDNLPNFKYIDSQFINPPYDPTNEYSAPYQWGTVGIIYNKKMVKEKVDSWDILWNKKYKGQILMFDNSRDAIGIALKKMGESYNTSDEKQLKKAAKLLKKQKPLVQAYVMDQIFNKMESNEAALAPYYAGDMLVMLETNPDLALAYPKEGSNLFVDAMCIPKACKNKEAAEKFIDFMLRPDIMAMNTMAVCYSSPEKVARDLLPEALRNSRIAYPDEDFLDEKFETYLNLPYETRLLYDALWIEIISD